MKSITKLNHQLIYKLPYACTYVWCWFKFDSILINSLFFWYTAHLFWKPYNYLGNREIHIKIMFYRVQSKTQGIPVMIVGNCLAVYKYFVFFCTMVMGNSNIKILSSIWTLYESFEYSKQHYFSGKILYCPSNLLFNA